jgi:molybdate transport system substrate-binding protein
LAAVQTMRKLKVYDALAPKIVKGASITQAYQYVATGNAELGFVALSQVIDEPGGSRWLVPTADHAPIEQQAVLLKTGEKNPAARAFVTFLKSPAAVAIIKRYGYQVRR